MLHITPTTENWTWNLTSPQRHTFSTVPHIISTSGDHHGSPQHPKCRQSGTVPPHIQSSDPVFHSTAGTSVPDSQHTPRESRETASPPRRPDLTAEAATGWPEAGGRLLLTFRTSNAPRERSSKVTRNDTITRSHLHFAIFSVLLPSLIQIFLPQTSNCQASPDTINAWGTGEKQLAN